MYLTPFYESERGDRARTEKYPQVPTPLLWSVRGTTSSSRLAHVSVARCTLHASHLCLPHRAPDERKSTQAVAASRSPVPPVTTQTEDYLDFLRDIRADLAAAASRYARHGEKWT